jgi:hypothetical protein
MPPRGCGDSREQDGLYTLTEVGAGGIPFWKCLVDPIVHMTEALRQKMGLKPRGVAMVPRKTPDGLTVYDCWDWVGAGNNPYTTGYWNAADFIEEGLRMHFSRRLPATTEVLSKLSPESKRPLVHPHAHVLNAEAVWKARRYDKCKTHQYPHEEDDQIQSWLCASLLWEMIEGGEPIRPELPRQVARTMPGFKYVGFAPMQPLVYAPGLFMVLPITRLELVKGDRTDEIAERVEKAKTGIELKVVDE